MSEREIIDISVMVSPATPEWPGDTPFSCMWTWAMEKGSSVNVSSVTMSPHVGTHADTPLHVTPSGAASDSLSLEQLSGPALVVDVSDLSGAIEIAHLARQIGSARPSRILLRTGRSIAGGTFPDSWPALSRECASELMRRGLRVLGVDCPSVDARDSKTLDVHHALLDHGACVLENLDLREVAPGEYALTALPMKIAGLDAVPVRATLT